MTTSISNSPNTAVSNPNWPTASVSVKEGPTASVSVEIADTTPWNKNLLSSSERAQLAQDHKLMEGIEKPEQDVSRTPYMSSGRPPGDTRSADQIINDNPILKNLGHQKDINRLQAYHRLGDWTSNNKDPDARADAAFNAARVLNYIDTSLSSSGEHRGKAHNNGDLEGITSSGDARHGTPAGMWKDFTEQGYPALRDDHRLDSNGDSHVRSDGTNKGNFQWGLGEAGKNTWFFPGLSNILLGAGNGEGTPQGVLGGAWDGFQKTRADGFDEALVGARTGNITAIVRGYRKAVVKNEATPQLVKDFLKPVT